MDDSRRVVVVGGASDTETVLKAVFEPRGARVERSRTARRPAKPSRTDVVVIDLDAHDDSQSQEPQPYRVLIGSHTPASILSGDRFLSKPFQYPELVRTIEELLNSRPAI